jgi:hypothetical protein
MVQRQVCCSIWGLSVYQWKRFIQYIIDEDPFMEEDDDEV